MLRFVLFVSLCVVLCAVCFCLCVVAGQAALTAESVSNIRLLHVVFRHGERAPVDTYPNDPHVNFTFPPYGWGQLTSVGRENQYQIGQFLRERYDEFLGNIYHPDIVAVKTTGVDRSIMSAQLQMTGMWPPADSQRWNKELSWQPISMTIDPPESDKVVQKIEQNSKQTTRTSVCYDLHKENEALSSHELTLLLVRIPCAPYSLELEDILNSTEVQDKLSEHRDLMQYLETQSGKEIRTADDVGDLYSTLNAEVEYGRTLPQWLEGVFPDKMASLTAYSFVINVKTPFLRKIKGGPLLKKILQDSRAAASNNLKPAGRKLFMYCGHDSTIVNLLSVLGVWEPQVPRSGIATLLEVHEDPKSHEYGLKVFLRNSTADAEPLPMEIPNCGYFCPLSKMEDLYQHLLPDDVVAECKSSDENYVPPPPKSP